MILIVSDDQVAVRVELEAGRTVEGRLGCRSAIPRVVGEIVTGNGGYGTRIVNPSDPVITAVSYE